MPTNRNLNQRIKSALYELKKQYGAGPISVYSNGGMEVNLRTGVKTHTLSVTEVHKVIVLPAKLSRGVVQTISQISANKAFVYGGYFDSRVRKFIIERRDAPDLELREDDYFVFAGRKYEIESIDEFEFDTAWVVTAKQLVGESFEQIFPRCVDNYVDLTQTATATL